MTTDDKASRHNNLTMTTMRGTVGKTDWKESRLETGEDGRQKFVDELWRLRDEEGNPCKILLKREIYDAKEYPRYA